MATPTDPKKTAKDDLAEYEVLSNLDHDGKRYEPGAKVSLTEQQAALLPGVVRAVRGA